MALTWPYANPHLAAYMFAAAATAAAYGQPSIYWNRAAVAAAAAATAPSAPYPTPPQPYHQHLMIRPPAAASGDFLNTAQVPDASAMLDSMGRHSSSSGCCTSPMCHGCSTPPNSSPITLSPTSIGLFKPLSSSSPDSSTKKLFQPYKNDLNK